MKANLLIKAAAFLLLTVGHCGLAVRDAYCFCTHQGDLCLPKKSRNKSAGDLFSHRAVLRALDSFGRLGFGRTVGKISCGCRYAALSRWIYDPNGDWKIP